MIDERPPHLPSTAIVCVERIADKPAVLSRLAQIAAAAHGLDAGQCRATLAEREALGSTAFGRGIAIPHARLPGIATGKLALVRLDHPIAFDAHDGAPVDLVFGLFSPRDTGTQHLRNLAALSRLTRDEAMMDKLRGAEGSDAIFALLSGQPLLRAA